MTKRTVVEMECDRCGVHGIEKTDLFESDAHWSVKRIDTEGFVGVEGGDLCEICANELMKFLKGKNLES